MFYQWNSKVPWLTVGEVSGWNDSWIGGYTDSSSEDMWTSANDPSPVGYRVPTIDEVVSLLTAERIWTVQNEVVGCKITDRVSRQSIFLPASGFRSNYGGSLYPAGIKCAFWINSAYGSTGSANYFYILQSLASNEIYKRSHGLSIRPVKQ